MSQDAATQLRRLLHLIPTLADGQPRSLEEIAALTGTDTDTLFRDFFSLAQRFGDPGGFVPGLNVEVDGRHVRVRTNHFTRPMRLTAPELAGLELGLAMLRRERPPGEQATIDRARTRLRAAISRLAASEIRRDVRHAETGAAADPAHHSTLRAAVRRRRKVKLTYRAADSEESHARVVCPYGLVAARGAWYLVAHCEDRRALRIFRMDRMEDVAALDDRFSLPDAFSLPGIVASGKVFHAEEPQSLRVRYSPRIARWIAEREGIGVHWDGSVTVEHPLADARWAIRHVLQYGPDAEVLEPEGLRDEIARRLRRLLA